MIIAQTIVINNMILVFIISLSLTTLILTLPSAKVTRKGDLIGVQKFHTQATPRIAGIPIFVSFFIGLWYFDIQNVNYLLLLLTSFPVFISGLIEDVAANVSPQNRFFSALLSVIAVFYWLDIGIWN